MKIKLNLKQIENIRGELKETDRKTFDTSDIPEVFRMLQYWSKSIGGKDAKIKSVTELPDGYLCRVNSAFRDAMKTFLKQARTRRYEQEAQDRLEEEMQTTAEKYERLIKEAEEVEEKRDRKKGPQ